MYINLSFISTYESLMHAVPILTKPHKMLLFFLSIKTIMKKIKFEIKSIFSTVFIMQKTSTLKTYNQSLLCSHFYCFSSYFQVWMVNFGYFSAWLAFHCALVKGSIFMFFGKHSEFSMILSRMSRKHLGTAGETTQCWLWPLLCMMAAWQTGLCLFFLKCKARHVHVVNVLFRYHLWKNKAIKNKLVWY